VLLQILKGSVVIHFIVALGAEAKPLISHFKLQLISSDQGFRLYHRDDYRLIISGSGRVSAAAATGWLAGQTPSVKGIWINIGTAGHGLLEKGMLFSACKIKEATSQRCWFPPHIIPSRHSPVRSELMTVDTVQTDYGSIGYDMEASAFIATAQRFSSSEFVQCLKVVSDTPQHSSDALKPEDLTALIAEHMESIEDYAQRLLTLHQHTIEDVDVEDIARTLLETWHFTSTQQHQLSRLLKQWRVVAGEHPIPALSKAECPSAKAFLARLHATLGTIAPGVN
jgi:adenosylhomocysteine nucleosidase